MGKTVPARRKKGSVMVDKLSSTISSGLLGTAVTVDQTLLSWLSGYVSKICSEQFTLVRNWHGRAEQFEYYEQAIKSRRQVCIVSLLLSRFCPVQSTTLLRYHSALAYSPLSALKNPLETMCFCSFCGVFRVWCDLHPLQQRGSRPSSYTSSLRYGEHLKTYWTRRSLSSAKPSSPGVSFQARQATWLRQQASRAPGGKKELWRLLQTAFTT